MLGIAIHCIQPSQTMLERGVCELAHSFFHFFNENFFFKWDQPSVVLVVYDVTSETSFSSCAKWLERVRSQKPEVHIPGNYKRIYCSIVLYVYVLIL